MAGKVKTWVWVVVGILVVGILFVIASAAAGIYFVTRNINAETVTFSAAANEFDAIRKRFSAHKPLIELDEKGDFLRSNTDRPAPPNAPRPETLHVMAFDPDDGGLVRVKIPFWLLRMKANGATINLGRENVNLEDLKLTVADIEKFGPTLILDQNHSAGDRVIVWTE